MAIRPMGIQDAPFVVDSWARSFLHSPQARNVSDDVYKLEQRSRIDRIVKKSVNLVLCSEDDPNHVSGFVIFEPPKNETALAILHYLLVHANLQGNGLGSKLFNVVRETSIEPSNPIWITHWTIPMKNVISKWNLIFNPYLLEVT